MHVMQVVLRFDARVGKRALRGTTARVGGKHQRRFITRHPAANGHQLCRAACHGRPLISKDGGNGPCSRTVWSSGTV
jgi:hypothetical protein